MKKLLSVVIAGLWLAGAAQAETLKPRPKPRNVIIFVADGLRYGIVSKDTAPALYDLQQNGVDFQNSHSLFPTVTTVNGSAIATGHGIGDTGEWSNAVYFGGEPLPSANGRPTPGLENNAALKDANERLGGNYLNEMSLLHLARDNGYQTAAIGKEGPVLIQDISAMDGNSTIFIDDSTGSTKPGRMVAVDPAVLQAISDAGLSLNPDDHKSNGSMYSDLKTGLKVSNVLQQTWFTDVTTKVILPRFIAAGKPFALVYWSRDPDGTQHNTGDGINKFSPGINGPTSLAGVRDASDQLGQLIAALKAQGVWDNTDIFVTADHGFSTISRQSKTSYAARFRYDDTTTGQLPPSFMAIDLSRALGLELSDDGGKPVDAAQGQHPGGTSLLGADPTHWDALVQGGGGVYLIYLDPAKAHDLARKIVHALTREDYVAGIFVADSLGDIPGTLAMSHVGLQGSALTPQPAIYVSLTDFALPSCVAKWKNPELCSIMVADGTLKQGQGSHGGFTRANTRNFMAAIGPDFKAGFADTTPISNADIAPTLAHILGLALPSKGVLTGRVLAEALHGGPVATTSASHVTRSQPADNGFVTVLESQSVGDEVYLDAAGMPGRVVGLKSKK